MKPCTGGGSVSYTHLDVYKRQLLIDYNSVWQMGAEGAERFLFSEKEGYTCLLYTSRCV